MSLMSVKSVPGCFVMIAPSLIGWPVAFFPLPRPHFDAGAVDFGAAADPPPPLSLSSSPHATRNAGSANATQSSAASDRGPFQVFLRTDPPPEIWLEGAHRPPPRSLSAQRYGGRTLPVHFAECQGQPCPTVRRCSPKAPRTGGKTLSRVRAHACAEVVWPHRRTGCVRSADGSHGCWGTLAAAPASCQRGAAGRSLNPPGERGSCRRTGRRGAASSC